MLPSQQILLCSFILLISLSHIKTSALPKKYDITIKSPGNTTAATFLPHKSVHVRYIPSNDQAQGIIIGFEPIIQIHHKAIEQLTVHLCDSFIDNSIWYDDETICNGVQSMLIYEWTPSSSSSIFRLPDNIGFAFNETRSIVLTVIYRRERRLHKEQSGIILYISSQSPKFQMGTILVGNKHQGTYFSCRSSNFPRLLFAIKKLNSNENKLWWRVHIIHIRQFGRKFVQSIVDSKSSSNMNQTHIEMAVPDLFFLQGDYLLIECENISQSNCYFIIYYKYKTKIIRNDHICQDNSFANLFKLIPPRETFNKSKTITKAISMDGTTIFTGICILLLVIWISIIIGCIIMRRIRGLVNFRTEPASSSTQKGRYLTGGIRTTNNESYQRTNEIDNIMQIDADHGANG